MTIFRAGAFETAILKEKSNDIAMAGARPTREGFDIAAGQRPKPAPGSSKRSYRARMDGIDSRLTCKKAPGEDAYYHRKWHRRGRPKTPTSLTLRELICSPSQECSRDEMAIQHSPPG